MTLSGAERAAALGEDSVARPPEGDVYSIDHRDLGRRHPRARVVTLEIDGNPVSVPAGTSSCVRRACGSRIRSSAQPTLEAFGSCGSASSKSRPPRLPARATTEATAGMQVRTDSPQLEKLRRACRAVPVDHRSTAPPARQMGIASCKRWLRARIRESRYAAGEQRSGSPPDTSNPYFVFDPICAVCSRCVRACNEVQGTHALTIEGAASHRGRSEPERTVSRVRVRLCGRCVESCPTPR